MAIIAKGKSGSFESPGAGTKQAVCVFVKDLGTHEQNFNNETKLARKVAIIFELAQKMKTGDNAGQPFLQSKIYTLSLHERATLSKHLESWFTKKFTPEQREEGFDIEKLIGWNALLSLVENDKGGTNIEGISPLAEGMQRTPVTVFKCPEWVQKMTEKSIEWKEKNGFDVAPEEVPPTDESDLPF